MTAPIRTLRVAQRQIVEIAKALRARARLIAMDEPTSSLTPKEFERLVEVIERLRAQGVSIIYVSHKMDEVYRVCQSATILRDGRLSVALTCLHAAGCACESRGWWAASWQPTATAALPATASCWKRANLVEVGPFRTQA